MRKGVFFLSVSLLVGLVVLTVGPLFAPIIPVEGCTPGFWKNHTDQWVLFTPAMTLGDVFQTYWNDHFANASATPPIPQWYWPPVLSELFDDPLFVALEYKGGPDLYGGARIMFRHAVAALLNAAHPDVFAYDVETVLRGTQLALSSLSRDRMLMKAGAFEASNELGCPLSGRAVKIPKK
jgi:hypothetical protein